MQVGTSLLLGASAALLPSLLPALAATPGAHADTVLVNGNIVTPNGAVQGLAIDKGLIVALGDTATIRIMADKRTQVIDLGGRTVLPGFQDRHVHPMAAGALGRACNFPGTATPEQVVAAVARCARQAKPGQWITGGVYQAKSFGATPPDRAMLDVVSANNPVVLSDMGMHNHWANSAALKAAGITRDTPDPRFGRFVRRSDGEPSGILNEGGAAGQVMKHVPPHSAEDNQADLRWALDKMLSWGVTSLTDALASQRDMDAYVGLTAKGLVKQRVRVCIGFTPVADADGRWDGRISPLIEARNSFSRRNITADCVKMLLDGVASDSHTAAMIEPYAVNRRNATGPDRGPLNISPPVLNAVVARLDSEGLSVKMHAIGDAAVREGIDAIAYARSVNGLGGPVHSIAHGSFFAPEDIKRAATLNLAVDISPYSLYYGPMTEEIRANVGDDRMDHWKPVRQLLDAHVLTVAGSDWPAGPPSANPWDEVETMVTRLPPGGVGKVLAPAEKATLQEAIRMFTATGAQEGHERGLTGAIEEGLAADLIVLDRNPYSIPATDLHNVRVLTTVIGGEIVYRAPK